MQSKAVIYPIVLAWLVVGAVVTRSTGGTYDFANTNFITINDSTNPPTIATPYPSIINVSGLNGQVITNLTVTLDGFSHSFPSDVSVMLMGPRGQLAVLMSECGGSGDNGQDPSVTNLTLTFDDASAYPVPLADVLYSAIFYPTALHTPLRFEFPAPVPAGNSNAPVSLAAFLNSDPDGAWKLFVVDDVAEDNGYISNGWSLNIATGIPLQISPLGSNLVFTWPVVSNATFALQTTRSLTNSGGWSNAPGVAAQIGGQYVLTNAKVSQTNAPQFYRLKGQ